MKSFTPLFACFPKFGGWNCHLTLCTASWHPLLLEQWSHYRIVTVELVRYSDRNIFFSNFQLEDTLLEMIVVSRSFLPKHFSIPTQITSKSRLEFWKREYSYTVNAQQTRAFAEIILRLNYWKYFWNEVTWENMPEVIDMVCRVHPECSFDKSFFHSRDYP